MAADRTLPILIVDDHGAHAAMVRTLLRRLGFGDIDAAPDGRAAAGMLERRRYGLVLSDLRMGAMSGLELLAWMRGRREHRETPFILLSGDAGAGREWAQASEPAQPPFAFLPKPLDVASFQANLDRVLASA
jgi:two-component system, chemotaxis family, chemotaxis protein CheY